MSDLSAQTKTRSSASQGTATWLYTGVWAVLVRWFRVPHDPPTLPITDGQFCESFQPDRGFLSYLKLGFWITASLFWLMIFILWIMLIVALPLVGILLAPLALAVMIILSGVAYTALHLRYDTTWYVITDRSIRIRRGIWAIRETTITFENVQNVAVKQGPLQRYFSIANVTIETAGSGGGSGGGGSHGDATANRGIIEGVTNASAIRDQIRDRLRASNTAGLGDDEMVFSKKFQQTPQWSSAHLEILREIRTLIGTGA